MLPGLLFAAGMLTAIAVIGFWQTTAPRPLLLAGLGAGTVALASAAVTLPLQVLWMVPLLTIAGAATIAVAARRGRRSH